MGFIACALDTIMPPETPSTLYNLGAHALEVTDSHTVLIAAYPTNEAPVKELVQLDSDEAYKLLLALQETFK